ncbi:MAG: DUF1467 family protein [Rickettsiales bacterium]|nr:DUF1467 family protein [Rickettsiales bacterium]
MTWSMGVFTFLNAWWLSLLIVMPFFVRPAKTRSAVEYAGAPQGMPWKKLVAVNTLVSLCATLVLAAIVHSGWFPMRDSL